MQTIIKTMKWAETVDDCTLNIECKFAFQLETGEQDGDEGVFVRHMDTLSIVTTTPERPDRGISLEGDDADQMAYILIRLNPNPGVREQFANLLSEACRECWELDVESLDPGLLN